MVAPFAVDEALMVPIAVTALLERYAQAEPFQK